jgi:hypothetical protein
LAINGESIQGKKVAEAMQLLQNSSDMVTLKVARSIDPIALMASAPSSFVYGHVPQQHNWMQQQQQQPNSLNIRNLNNGTSGNGYHRVQQQQQQHQPQQPIIPEQMNDRDSGKLGYTIY